ncbi:hypothetical protein Tco_0030550, partial [Tanacetum coccineum]
WLIGAVGLESKKREKKTNLLSKRVRHYRSDFPELKNQNHGNQAEGTGAHGMVYAFGGGETEQDINNIEDEIEA